MELMKIYANLHLHSTHSDGGYSPTELVHVAKDEGYKALAITDHDTATAYPELAREAQKAGMEYIIGAEFAVFKPKPFHIASFGFDPEYPEMKKYLADMAHRITENTRLCFEENVQKGYFKGITWGEVLEYNKSIAWLCNNHVFRAMLAKGLVEEKNYMSWFYAYFEKQRGHYPSKIEFLPLNELVSLVKKAGGVSLVAHPHGQLDDIDMLVENGVEGLEVLNDLNDDEKVRALKIALERDLYVGGGSDHYGLCSGFYSGFPSEEELKKDPCYIPPLSTGTSYEFFHEIKDRKLNREYREKLKKELGM